MILIIFYESRLNHEYPILSDVYLIIFKLVACLDLSNRLDCPFWPIAQPEKRRVGTEQSSTIAGWVRTTQKDQAVLGRGCQAVCHAGHPIVPVHRIGHASQPAHYANSPFSPLSTTI